MRKLTFQTIFILLFLSALSIFVPNQEIIELNINSKDNPSLYKRVGPNGTIGFFTDKESFPFFDSDIEQQTKFIGNISLDGKIREWDCRLWDPKNMNVAILCRVTDSPDIYDFLFNYNEIEFDNFTIIIQSDTHFQLEIKDYDIPFIYSDYQIIDLDQEKDSYELKFKADSYNGEKLVINEATSNISFTDFDACTQIENELTCYISRKKIEGILTFNSSLRIVQLDETFGISYFDFSSPIKAKYSKPLENIHLIITKALNNVSAYDTYAFFETNITDISPLTTDIFSLEVWSGKEPVNIDCFFKKYDVKDIPLLLLCKNDVFNYYFEVYEQTNLTNIHYQYSFNIYKSDIYEKINSNYKGRKMILNYPETLNLSNSENNYLYYFMEGAEYFQDIKLVADSSELDCTNNEFLKICTINSTHFDGFNSGYYMTHYSDNSLGDAIAYDVRPINVIMEPNILIKVNYEDNKESILIGKYFSKVDYNATIPLITDFDDTESNIFNVDDIEEKTKFKTDFEFEIGYGKTSTMTLNCRLWKPQNEKLRLLCNTYESLYSSSSPRGFTFNRATFKYNDYTIIIKSNDNFKYLYLDDYIPFLYSDKQFINVDDGEDNYKLKFKFDLYNKDPLYLYSENNYISLDNCNQEQGKKELICIINKNTIEENLFKETNYKLGYLNKYYGSLPLNSVLDINISYNKTIEKQNVTLSIYHLLLDSAKKGQTIAFRTNLENIDNFISDKFTMEFAIDGNFTEQECYLKKKENYEFNNFALLLCTIQEEGIFNLPESGHISLNDIHYKYNFDIEINGGDEITIKDQGSQIYLTSPAIKNLTLEQSFTFYYLFDPFSYGEIISIGQSLDSAENVSCTYASENLLNTKYLKICSVDISFFKGKKDGYYYIFHKSSSDNSSAIVYYDSTPFYIILPPENFVIMRIQSQYNYVLRVGNNGLLLFGTNYNDTLNNAFDIEELDDNFTFSASVSDDKNYNYDAQCRLWKPKDDNIRVFCKINEKLHYSKQELTLNEVVIKYHEYTVLIISEYSVLTYFYDYNIPFLYGDKQTIDLNEDTNTYELKFKTLSYNNEFIYLNEDFNQIILDNCTKNNKDLICTIQKDYLEANIQTLADFSLYYYIEDVTYFIFSSVLDVTFKYSGSKSDINLNITKLLTVYDNFTGYTAFETDVDNVPDLISNKNSRFNLEFKNYNTQQTTQVGCYFKKSKATKLLLLCHHYESGYYQLQQTTYNKTINDKHYKYNFIIAPMNNKELINAYWKNFMIHQVYPTYIDLTLKDKVNFIYLMTFSYYLTNIRLNPDSDNLNCISTGTNFLECEIPLSHFINKKSDYYYTYQQDLKGNWRKLYEPTPVYVKLPEENDIIMRIKKEYNKNEIKIGEKGIIYLETDYDDNKYHFFDNDDFDEYSQFETFINDEEGNKYYTECNLWKPKNANVRIFCSLEENLKYKEQNITLDTYEIEYNNFTIKIYSQDSVEVKQLDVETSFLYSDTQNINIEEYQTSYNISFKLKYYNRDNKLYLYGNNYNIIPLDNCFKVKGSSDLICNIQKELIDEKLTISGEEFKLGEIIDNYGINTLDNVFNIKINYYNITKENITIKYIYYSDAISEIGSGIGIQTILYNYTDFISGEFDHCRFQKVKGFSLLIICTPFEEGTFYFGNYSEPLYLDKLHYKYNFILGPIYNIFEFNVESYGTQVKYVYPQELEFGLEEYLTINYIMDYPERINYIKYNIIEDDYLECKNLEGMKKCIVPLEHFKDEKNGRYLTYYINHLNSLTIFFTSPEINVILPPENYIIMRINATDNKNTITVGKQGTLYFIVNYKDDKNIFNPETIEEISQLSINITNDLGENYLVNCRLWEPLGEKLRLFCKLDNMLNTSTKEIQISTTSFEYNNYTIFITSKDTFKVKQLDYEIPFFYSDKQEINMEENIDTYEFKFKIEKYDNNEELYIYYGFSYILLDNCVINNKELICTINKEDIESELIREKNSFKLSDLNGKHGSGSFDQVLRISIIYKVTKKIDINLSITELLSKYSELGTIVAYETNITEIPNLRSNHFLMYFYNLLEDKSDFAYCYFKKNNGAPLLLLCDIFNEGYLYISPTENVTIIEDEHYKYNFYISPISNYNTITVSNEGTEILLTYPKILNFTFEDTLTIKYIMPLPWYAKNIKLNPSSSDLDCSYETGITSCIVPLSHFEGEQSGYYYTYHFNEYTNYSSSIYYDATPFNVVLPPKNLIVIRIREEYNNKEITIGNKGTLDFVTDYDDTEKNVFDASNIEENTLFDTVIRDQKGNEYNTVCRLWKPINENLRLFCQVQGNLFFTNQNITLDLVCFDYNNYTIAIKFEDAIKVKQVNYDIPFLYSDKQEITIENNITSYEFKFKSDKYYDNVLLIPCGVTYIILDTCKKDKNEKDITCIIEKEKLEENLIIIKDALFNLKAISDDLGIISFNSVLNIYIKYGPKEKDDIYVNIGKLLNNVTEVGVPTAYETSINGDVPNLVTNYFLLSFNDIAYNKSIDAFCLFKKTDAHNLRLLCDIINHGYHHLTKISEKKRLDDISYKYNFIIVPDENNDLILVEDFGTEVGLTYPDVLNFTIVDSLIIKFIMPLPFLSENIKLNPDSSELECSYVSTLKSCIVPISHFKEKQSGYYDTYHSNHLDISSIYYDSTPFKVILPPDDLIVLRIKSENNKAQINVGTKGTIVFVTDYDDTEKNIFNIDTIVEATTFITTIKDENENSYEVECNLWKKSNENIRLFCNLIDKSMKYKTQNIKLNDVTFTYDNYTIIIYPQDYIQVNQYSYHIPFFYSNKQNIQIKESVDNYELKFYIGSYDNDFLTIFKNEGYIILDNCEVNKKELKCNITREQLEQVYTSIYITQSYNLGTFNDNSGFILFSFVDEISLNHEQIQDKEDIYIGITKSLTNVTESQTQFGYETNITNIPKFISETFRMKFNNSTILCYFRKELNRNLLLLCDKYVTDEEQIYLGNTTEEIFNPDIHFKYNLRIQPYENYEIIYLKGGRRYDLDLVTPEILDFTKEKSITLRFKRSSNIGKIKLNPDPDSDYIKCRELDLMEICTIPIEHFGDYETGYFDVYHMNHLGGSTIFYELPRIKVILPNVNIKILHEDNNYMKNIGKEGTIYFVTNYRDEKNIFNADDIEEKTEFYNTISDSDGYQYQVKCRLWKPLNKKLRILCDLINDFEVGYHSINFDKVNFNYEGYNIIIKSESDYMKIQQYSVYIPFIYSDKQIINVDEEDNYELKFNIVKYNNDVLFIFTDSSAFVNLDKCENITSKRLICTITKSKLEEISYLNSQEFRIGSMIDNIGVSVFSGDLIFNIIFNYNITKKEDIYVDITKLLQNNYGFYDSITYETNINNSYISNIYSGDFYLDFTKDTLVCNMKKTESKPLLLLCEPKNEGTFSLGEISEEIRLENISIKYNFIIKPTINEEIFTVKDFGVFVYFTIPEKIDFNSDENILIKYYSLFSDNIQSIKLNPNSDDLKCEKGVHVITCNVPKSHFERAKSGYYYSHYMTYLNGYSTLYSLTPIKIELPYENEFTIKIKDEDNSIAKIVGEKGTISFITNYNDNELNIFNISDIEDLTSFKTIIYDNSEKHNATCRLWKPMNNNIRVFCELEDNLNSGNIMMDKVTFEYKDYNITIICEAENIYVYQLNYTNSFIYSDEQEIIVEEDIDDYYLIFKVDHYNGEYLELYHKYNEIILENCEETNNNELICPLSKENIETILIYDEESFDINIINDNYGLIVLGDVLNIKFNYKNITKEDIFINITKLKDNYGEQKKVIAFETNITSISPVITGLFDLGISDGYGNESCYFKKLENYNLLLLCQFNKEGVYHLEETSVEIELNNINIKYNFRIQPIINQELFNISKDNGIFMFNSAPQVFDYTKDDVIILKLITAPYYRPDAFIINKYIGDNLECKYLYGMIKCIVPLSHFDYEQSGDYNLYYIDTFNKLSMFYELNPIKVILPERKMFKFLIKEEDNNKAIDLGQNGTLYFITDYNDTKNIFDIDDIEEKTKFKTTISDEDNNHYETDCRLFKQTNEKIVIFCNLKKNLLYEEQKIFLNSNIITYNDYEIIFYSETYIKVKQLNYEIPFIYSDKQYINIKEEENNELYELKYKFDSYNNDILLLHGSQFNYIILDNCEANKNELICKLSKEKIIKALINNNEKFSLETINDNMGSDIFKFTKIIINHEISKKEDIEIYITKLLENVTESGTPIAYDTNVDSLPELVTHLFQLELDENRTEFCYFKKTNNNNLLLLWMPIGDQETYLGKITEDISLNDIHYKYNFIIKPVENYDIIYVNDFGASTSFSYPETLNFTSENSVTIYYIMTLPFLSNNIKLNPDSSSELECQTLSGIKKCTVPISHFKDRESGIYNTYHLNHFDYYSIYYDANPFNVILPPLDKRIEINIDDEFNKETINIGEKGTLYFVTSYNDSENIFDIDDIEEKTSFKTIILDEDKNKYNANCNLWKPINKNILLFCDLDEIMSKEEQNINFESVYLEYKEYKIYINSYAKSLKVKQYNANIPLFYTDKQIINIEEGIDNYPIKFNVRNYNNEILILVGQSLYYNVLDNCEKGEKQIICNINKDIIEGVINNNNDNYFLLYIHSDTLGLFSFNQNIVPFLIINHYEMQKEDISVKITKLLESGYETNYLVAYETNVESISSVSTDRFDMTFNDNLTVTSDCFFQKSERKNLLLLCMIKDSGTFYLGNIEEKRLDNINIKYNFIIEQTTNNETFTYEKEPILVAFNYPKELDFSTNDNLIIEYFSKNPEKFEGIKLNPESDYLKCEDVKDAKKCIVPSSHFENKHSGYYDTYYINYLNGSSIMYQLSPIKIKVKNENEIVLRIKEEYNKFSIQLGQNGTLYFETNYNDTENIFDIDDIEEKTEFKSIIFDEENNNYDVTCRLFKQIDERLAIFCKLDYNLLFDKQNITLNTTKLMYNDYNIIIYSETKVTVKQLKYEIPFIYSDKQYINIKEEENNEIYELKFKFDSYNNDILLLHGFQYDLEILDNCEANKNELICKISKGKILKVLSNNNEVYNLETMNDNLGTYTFKFTNIIINHEISKKEDIEVYITKLLENVTESGTPIAYDTNVDSLPELVTNLFQLELDNNRTEFCYFKKTNNNNLLLLWMPLGEQETYLGKITEDISLNDIHYKYNFIIKPVENYDIIYVKEFGPYTMLTYPETLNFTSEDTLTIRYIMILTFLGNNLKLNPDSPSYLECQDIGEIKKCIVPKEHFEDKESGYYYTHHLNHLNGSSIYYDSTPFNVILPPWPKKIKINIEKQYNERTIQLGVNGTLYFVTSYNDTKNIFDIDDIEEKTKFKTTISDKDNNKYIVQCRLWKPRNDSLRAFCDMNEVLPEEYMTITLESVNFDYNEYKVMIISSDSQFKVRQFNVSLPFLYSDNIEINVEKDKEIYDMKFNIGKYNNDILVGYTLGNGFIIFDDCKIEGKILRCEISKEKLEEICSEEIHSLYMAIINDDAMEYNFDTIPKIIINFYDIEKQDIPVIITKLINNAYETNNLVVYETNVDYISNVISYNFPISTDKFDSDCFFKKVEGKNLKFLCTVINNGTYSLGEIKEKIELNNINIKYNFIIQPVINEEIFTVQEEGMFLPLEYPQVLDFTLTDSLIIKYYESINLDKIKGIKLNPDGDELNCENKKHVKICIVPKSHFEGKTSGLYDTYHINHVGDYIINYELSPIKVILPNDNDIIIKINDEDNKDIIKVGKNGYLYFVTDYKDEQNIFKTDNITFIGQFSDSNNLEYNAECKIWKPNDEIIRLICQLEKDLNIGEQNIYINKVNFEYDNYNIIITSDAKIIKVKQLETKISFLYSDIQEINLEDNTQIIFKKGNYLEKIPLYLYKNEFRFVELNCVDKNDKIECNIPKDKLLLILSYSGENYYLSEKIESEGNYILNSVLGVKIKYYIPKTDLSLKIGKLLTSVVSKDEFISYETNLKNEYDLEFTDYFSLNTASNENINCLFKNNKNDNLLLLCDAKEDGIFKLGKIIKQEINSINILYNFNIDESDNNEEVNITNIGTKILSVNPQELNFKEKDSYTIIFETNSPEKLNGIKLNPESDEELECVDKPYYKECIITKEHFTENGNYYIHHTNHLGTKTISYEVSPIKVTVEEIIPPIPSDSDSDIESDTDTDIPTPSDTDTDIPTPSDTDTDIPTPSDTDTDIPTPSDTDTDIPTPSDTDSDIPSDSDSVTPSDTDKSSDTDTVIPSDIQPSGDKDDTNYAAIIIGSVIGGLVLIGIIVFLIWYFKCRNKKQDDGKSDDSNKLDAKINEEIKQSEINEDRINA